jgi:hypothetical protein
MNYFRTYKQWAGPTSGVKYKLIFRKKLLQYIQVQHIQNLKIIYLEEKKINYDILFHQLQRNLKHYVQIKIQ